MSQDLWIYGPGSLWVCEDDVLALAEAARRWSLTLEHSAVRLASIDTTRSVAELHQAWASVRAEDLNPLRARIRTLAEDAQWLHTALMAYAAQVASTERARVATFDIPRESVLALMVVSAKRYFPDTSPSSWGVQEAALSALHGDVPPGEIEITRVSASSTAPVSRAVTVEDRVGRIPSGEHPIRIEKYRQSNGTTEVDVFIAGTQEWSVGTSANPFDMESNIALIAGVSAASVVAVELAMKHAGVRPGDRVSFVGHSQGGLIAARLAESGRYQTSGLLTVGAPLGTAPIRGDYPALALEHRDDLVPELGGHQQESRITTVHSDSGAFPGDVVAAHAKESYLETARAVDDSPASQHLPAMPTSPGIATPEFFSAHRAGGR
ncbi:hypothetical protein N8964_00585 [Pontimonas sp.]|nr:hypothetical protein [Pontimonas sp.]